MQGGPKVCKQALLVKESRSFSLYRLMQVSLAVRLLLTLMAGGELMEVEHSLERTHLRWIDQLAMQLVGLQNL